MHLTLKLAGGIAAGYSAIQFMDLKRAMNRTPASDADRLAWVFVTRNQSAWGSAIVAAVLGGALGIVEAADRITAAIGAR